MYSLMHMTRRNILEVTEDLIKILKKEDEISIKSLSKKAGSQWRTTAKSLEFLKSVGIVKERHGKKTNKEERLFRLVDKKAHYKKSN